MDEDVSDKLHELAVTAIIVKDGKYLITHRSNPDKKFYDMWTVPGGRLELSDYERFPKDTSVHWYNIVGKVLRREIKEEVGLEIENVDYLTSIAMNVGKYPSLILSFIADYKSGEVTLQEDELDKAEWVTLEEAKEYDLIEGIYEELVMADGRQKGIKNDWVKS
ncbi:NUDIX domain-containing protein [candidate division KSB1 bacterium]